MSVQQFRKNAKREFMRLQQFRGVCSSISGLCTLLCFLLIFSNPVLAQTAFIRINQAGYLSQDDKKAIAFSKTPLEGGFAVLDAATKRRFIKLH